MARGRSRDAEVGAFETGENPLTTGCGHTAPAVAQDNRGGSVISRMAPGGGSTFGEFNVRETGDRTSKRKESLAVIAE